MLCGDAAVVQASVLDGLSFDPFSFQKDGLAAPEVDVSRRQIGDALVVSQMVVVGDEFTDLGLESTGQIVVLEQDAVLERLMPALDLALCHGMIRPATRVADALFYKPVCQLDRDVGQSVVAEQAGTSIKGKLVEAGRLQRPVWFPCTTSPTASAARQ